MRTMETRRYEMLVRVRQFGEAHRDRFPESTAGAQAFATIAAAVTELSGHAVSKLSTAREAKSARVAAREALVDRLDAIARAARVIAEDTPGFDDPFLLPKRRQANQALLIAGRLFVQDAEERKGRFITLGMPDTFVRDLASLVQQFEQTLLGLEAGRDGQTAAKAGIVSALESGLAAARKLDVIVPLHFPGDPVTMAVWERDRRLDNPPRRRKKAASSSVIAPVAPPSAPVSTVATASTVPLAPVVTPAPAAGESGKRSVNDVAIGVAS